MSVLPKSVVGIDTSNTYLSGGTEDYQRVLALQTAYTEFIVNCGGVPVLLASNLSPQDAKVAYDRCDAFLEHGGTDISPLYSGIEHDATVEPQNIADNPPDSLRDKNNYDLIKYAIRTGKPLLGICRGFEVLNSALGGELGFLDSAVKANATERHYIGGDDNPYYNYHSVELDRRHSKIEIVRRLIEANDGYVIPRTASAHHMQVVKPGKGLVSVGHSPSGTLEMVVSENGLLVGVQFHPEQLDSPTSRVLGTYLVELAQQTSFNRD